MAMILRILTVLCLVEMKTASVISGAKGHDRDIEEKPECPWSHFGSRINSLETDLQALTHKMDALTEKTETQARKMDSQTQKVDALTEKMDRALNRKECPPGFNYLPEVDQCLKLNTNKMTWAQAHDACHRVAQGGHMVTITSSAKQDAVRRYLEKQFEKEETAVCLLPVYTWCKQSVWISGQRQISNRCDTPFVWKYKPGVEVPFAFTKWYPGEPNCHGNSEQCAHIAGGLDYVWNDLPCSWSLCSVCEI